MPKGIVNAILTPEQFAAKAEELKEKQGITLTGNSGTISKHGLEADYSYDGSLLTITINELPIFHTEASIAERLQEWLEIKP